MTALREAPIRKARTSFGIDLDDPHTLLTRDQYDLLVQVCYDDICSGRVNEKYLKVIIVGLPERVRMDEQGLQQTKSQAIITGVPERIKTDKGGVEKAMEHLILLASRMVKGEECLWCEEPYLSPTRGSAQLRRQFAKAMKKLDEISQELALPWSMSDRSQFALDKLCSIQPTYYGPVDHLLQHSEYNVDSQNLVYLSMWCHNNENWKDGEDQEVVKFICHCWDTGMEGSHDKYCFWGENGDGSDQVYEP